MSGMKFKITIPAGTSLHSRLEGLDPRARNFELISLASRGLDANHKEPANQKRKSEPVAASQKKPFDDDDSLFELDELISAGVS